ncbi:hypothetical protein [Mucilaginibacter sp.]|uniref:hypothetical protein n=1 Tax=Mucilaginibacter sp. TaxID=1882438 RepID=UPI003264FDDF
MRKIFLLIFAFGCLSATALCQRKPASKSPQSGQPGFITALINLKEFKDDERKADSLSKASGIPQSVSFELINDPMTKKDSTENLMTIFIKLDRPFDPIILHIVKINAATNKIVSVENNIRKK